MVCPGPTGSAHIAMVVANDVSTDTRVRKMAHDLAEAGLRVSVIGVSRSGRREELSLGQARVIRIPVGRRLRIRRGTLSRATNQHQLSHEIGMNKARYFAHQRNVAAEVAWLRADYFAARTRRNEEASRRARVRIDSRADRGEKERGAAATSPPGLWQRLAAKASTRLDESRKRRQSRREDRLESRFRRTEKRMNQRLERHHRRYAEREEKLTKKLADIVASGDRPDWRRVLPELHDYEQSFGPVLDSLDADVIHAQDVHLLGVAARAVSRARGRGLSTKLVYDAHEYIQGLAPPRPVQAWSSLEAEYIGQADAVVTVAPAIGALLKEDYELGFDPTVVMNIPAVAERPEQSLRQVIGLDESQLLLVYSGGLDATRGVHTLVRALGDIPDAHLALVSKASTSYTIELEEIADEGGYRDRLHFAPFVEPQHVVGYLASADVGVHTIVSGPINHEVTLPNKVFEYMHARLPIVISNCKAMSELVETLGVGRSFLSEDTDSLVEILKEVIANRDHYSSVYAERPEILDIYSWTTERRTLLELYGNLLGSQALETSVEGEHLPSLVSTVAG